MQDPFVQCEKIKDEERETLDSAKEQEFKGWGGVLIGYEDEVIPYYITSYKYYKVDISVRRVGIITAPRIPPDHPNVRYLRTLTSEFFHAPDITEARLRAVARVEDPNTPEFQKCLDFYYVPFKTLQWKDWQEAKRAGRRNTNPFLRKPTLSQRGFQVDCQNPCLRGRSLTPF